MSWSSCSCDSQRCALNESVSLLTKCTIFTLSRYQPAFGCSFKPTRILYSSPIWVPSSSCKEQQSHYLIKMIINPAADYNTFRSSLSILSNKNDLMISMKWTSKLKAISIIINLLAVYQNLHCFSVIPFQTLNLMLVLYHSGKFCLKIHCPP